MRFQQNLKKLKKKNLQLQVQKSTMSSIIMMKKTLNMKIMRKKLTKKSLERKWPKS